MQNASEKLKKTELLIELEKLTAERNKLARKVKKFERVLKSENAEKKIHQLYNQSPFPICVVSAKGKFEFINDSFTRLLGYDLKDLPTTEQWFNLAYPDPKYREYVLESWVEATGSGADKSDKEWIFKVSGKNGNVYDIKFKLIVANSGKTNVFLENVTQIQSIKSKLIANKKRYKDLLDNVNDAVYLWNVLKGNKIGKCVEANKKATEFLGFSKKELQKLTPKDLTAPKYRSKVPQFIEKLFENGENIFITKHKTKAGNIVDVEVNAKIVFIANRMFVLSITRNISDRIELLGKLKNLYDNIPIGMLTYELNNNNDLILKSANPIVDKILNINSSKLIGFKIEDAFPELAATEIPELYRGVIKTGKTWHSNKVVYQDKTIHGTFDVSAFKTSPNEVVVSFADISEKQIAADKLAFSEHQYELLIKQSPISVEVYDMDGTLQLVNNAWERIWNTPAEKVIGKFNFFKDKNLKKLGLLKPIENAFKGNAGKIDEVKYVAPDDPSKVRWLSTQYYPIRNQLGKVSKVIVLNEDITSRKIAEASLLESEEINRMIVENSHDGILIIDDNFKIEFANKEIYRLTEKTSDELLGFDFRTFLADNEKKFVINNYESRIAGDKTSPVYNFYFETKSGKKKTFEVRSTLFTNSNGEVKTLSHLHDITARLKSDQINEIIYDITQRANEIVGLKDFLVVIKDRLNELLKVENFYVALYDKASKTYSFPYHIDKYDSIDDFTQSDLNGSLTDLVRRTGKPLFVDETINDELVKKGKIEKIVGNTSKVWMGAPLRVADKTIGVLAIQEYDDDEAYNTDDFELLKIISENVSTVILRKQAEDRIQENEEKYRNYIQTSSEGIYRIEFNNPISVDLPIEKQIDLFYHESFIAECNEAFVNMYGFKSVDEIKNKRMIDLYSDSDKDKNDESNRQFIRSGYRIVDAPTIEKNVNNEVLFILTNAVGIIKDKSLVSVWGSQRNVTDLKKAEEALKKSEENYRAIFNSTSDGIFIHDYETGAVLDVNYTAEKMFGLPKDEIKKSTASAMSSGKKPYDEQNAIEKIQKTKSEGPQVFEWQSKRNDGTIFWTRVHLKQIEIGGEKFILASVRDISERKAAEEARKRSEASYKEIFNSTHDAILIHDSETAEIIDVNRGAMEMLGYNYDELLNLTIGEISSGLENYNQETAAEIIRNASLNNQRLIKWQFKQKNSNLIWGEVNHRKSIIDGKEKVLSVIRDISDRVTWEKTLQESENKFRALYETANDAIFLMNEEIFIDCNPKTLEMFNCKRDNIVGKTPTVFSPAEQPNGTDSKLEAKEKITAALSGTPQFFEWKHKTLDGKLFDAEVSLSRVELQGAMYIHAIVRDITERKIAEEAIKNNEEKYRTLFAAEADALMLFDLESKVFIEVNDAAVELYGFSQEEFLNLKAEDLSAEKESTITNFKLLEPGKLQKVADRLHIKKDGSTFHVEISSNVFELNGKLTVCSAVRDITERLNYENAIKESEKLNRNLIESSPVGILYLDNNGVVILENDAMKNIIGLRPNSTSQIIGFKLKDLPPIKNSRAFQLINRLMNGEIIKGEEVTYRSLKNKLVELEVFGAPIFDEEGNLSGAVIMAQNITERKLERKELEKTKSLLLAAIEQNPAGIIIADAPDVRIKIANAAAAGISGKSIRDLTEFNDEHHPSNWQTFYPDGEDYKYADLPLSKAVLEGKSSTNVDIVIKRPNGEARWVLANAAPIRDNEGNIEAGIVVLSDLTEQRRAEEALRDSEARVRTLLKNLPVIVWAVDLNGIFTFSDGTPLAKLNLNPSEVVGKSIFEVYSANDKVISDIRKVLRGESFTSMRNDKNSFLETHYSPIQNTDGTVQGAIGIEIDVTERKRTEEVLRSFAEDLSAITGEPFFNSVVKYLSDCTEMEYCFIGRYYKNTNEINSLAFWDVDSISNNFSYNLKNTPCEMTFSSSSAFYPADAANLFPKDKIIVDMGIQSYFGIRLNNKNEEPIGILVLMSKKGISKIEFTETVLKIFAVRCSAELERISSEEQVIKAKNEAENANKLKSEFLAQMSHEIRTPINTILSFSSLIKDETQDVVSDDMQYGYSSIDNAGKRIIRTIDLILNMSEIQTGTYEPTFRNINLYDECLSDIYTEFKLKAKQNNLSLALVNNSKSPIVYADHYTVSQIFNNLVDNGIKYTHEGGIIITINEKSDELIIICEDTGIGISEEYLPNLFKAFSQEDTGYTRRFEGNGLGLALVKNYCDINSATISVESRKGVGSKFTVIFPRELNQE